MLCQESGQHAVYHLWLDLCYRSLILSRVLLCWRSSTELCEGCCVRSQDNTLCIISDLTFAMDHLSYQEFSCVEDLHPNWTVISYIFTESSSCQVNDSVTDLRKLSSGAVGDSLFHNQALWCHQICCWCIFFDTAVQWGPQRPASLVSVRARCIA